MDAEQEAKKWRSELAVDLARSVGHQEGLEEALVIVNKIMRKAVKRDGSPSRAIQIREALQAALKDARILRAQSK